MENKNIKIAEGDNKRDFVSAKSKFWGYLYGSNCIETTEDVTEVIYFIDKAKNNLIDMISVIDKNKISYTDYAIIDLYDIFDKLTDIQKNLAEFGVLSYHR